MASYRIGQVAELLGVSVDTVRRWADAGRLGSRRTEGGQRMEIVAQVEVQSGPHRLVSLMTREAADDLGLAPGMLAVAAVKATNVVVELPPRT